MQTTRDGRALPWQTTPATYEIWNEYTNVSCLHWYSVASLPVHQMHVARKPELPPQR